MKWSNLPSYNDWEWNKKKIDANHIFGMLVETHRYKYDMIEYDHFVGLDQYLTERIMLQVEEGRF